ncbi:MAG: hypothetical protein LUC50_05980 [Ruminococcus sp.]|nr:hypothetical protein [Ruminococcus sp.]
MIQIRWNKSVLQIHFSFFLVAALAGLTNGSAFFAQLLLACLLHECGHLLLMA